MAKILIIDDDLDLVQSMQTMLETKEYSVIVAHNGVDGLSMAKKKKPDLIILDVMMTTDTEGFDTARKLREDETTRKIPVILLTGIKKAKGLPFSFEPDDDWLPVQVVMDKPANPELLLKKVAEMISA